MTTQDTQIPDAQFILFAKRALKYIPEQGILVWTRRYNGIFDDYRTWSEDQVNSFNGKHLGKEAFCCPDNGYKQGFFLGKKVKAHRMVWLVINGRWPSVIDHINRVRDDNRIENLREVTHAENMRNMSLRRDNKTGYAGVNYVPKSGVWNAHLNINGSRIHLGTFQTKSMAVAARKEAEVNHGFHP